MLKPDFIGSNRGGCQLSGSVLAGAGDSTFNPVSLWGAGRDRKADYNRKLIRSKTLNCIVEQGWNRLCRGQVEINLIRHRIRE